MSERRSAVILGAGINGAAIARQLALEAFAVHLVDEHDIAFGATAYSSRLVHGGLRYLEYAEFSLVREALAERARLLHDAPHLIRPLKLFVPVVRGAGGWTQAIQRFLGFGKPAARPRGLGVVRCGLWLYDLLSWGDSLPRHQVHRVPDPQAPTVDEALYSHVCSYWDAQVPQAERLTLAFLTDAAEAARERGGEFHVWSRHVARVEAGAVRICLAGTDGDIARELRPDVIVNATGAWVDQTLSQLDVPSERLMGGTKGSHFFTLHPQLRAALGETGIYAEAPDGRPVFLMPLGPWAFIGTTDIHYEGRIEDAVATEAEIEYLIDAVNRVMPAARIARDDVAWHYAGVRPLPFVHAASNAAVTRRHKIVTGGAESFPLLSVVGGKLTTCRSLAEEVASAALKLCGAAPQAHTRDRPVPGGEDYPQDSAAREQRLAEIAAAAKMPREQVDAVWNLCGSRAARVCAELSSYDGANQTLGQTALPLAFARWSIRHEWAATLDDLVERRLMLLYDPRLDRACLRQLAALLVAEGRLTDADVDETVAAVERRLETHFGRRFP